MGDIERTKIGKWEKVNYLWLIGLGFPGVLVLNFLENLGFGFWESLGLSFLIFVAIAYLLLQPANENVPGALPQSWGVASSTARSATLTRIPVRFATGGIPASPGTTTESFACSR